MSQKVKKGTVLSSLLWKLLERSSTQGVQFIVTIVLARILLPEEFGVIVLVSIFISIAEIFVQSGFNTALIQKKDADERDFSSVFYLSFIVAILLYVFLYFTAPLIANFFAEPALELVLRVLSITLFFGTVNSIQVAVLSRYMQFKKLFTSSLGAVIISAIVGIAMAYSGYGVWALVGQQLSNKFIITIILWFTVRWWPQFIFDIDRIKGLFSFGSKILVSSIVETIYRNLRSLLIGKTFNSEMLGYYDRGDRFPKLIVQNIDGSIQSVMFPTLSSIQNDKQRVKAIVRRSIKTSSFVVFPLMIGLAVIAEPLINILLTEKWLPAVPLLQILCFYYALIPIHTANLQAINALGRSDVFLKLEIVKKTLGIGVLLISIPFGIYAIAFSAVIIGVISSIINAFPNSKFISYSYVDQWKDIFPSFLLSLIMGGLVYTINWLGFPSLLTLIIQVIIGVILYIFLAKLFKLEAYSYLISTITELKRRKKR